VSSNWFHAGGSVDDPGFQSHKICPLIVGEEATFRQFFVSGRKSRRVVLTLGVEFADGRMYAMKRPTEACLFLCLFVLVLCAPQTEAQERYVPKLGSQVPSYVWKARTRSEQCPTEVNRHDPCTSVMIDDKLFTIAWDKQTKAITYLFTDDHRIVTDSELGVGGLCRLTAATVGPEEIAQYMDWLVTPKWADNVRILSGDAVWYAVLHQDTAQPKYGKIMGFVQRQYLKVVQ